MTLARRSSSVPAVPDLQPFFHVSGSLAGVPDGWPALLMDILGQYPQRRMRRLRRDDFSRRLARENRLTTDDLIYPVFVFEGKNATQPVPPMPGIERMTSDRLLPLAEECMKLRIPALALFPAIEPSLKTADGREATNARGLIPRAVKALKERFPELGI